MFEKIKLLNFYGSAHPGHFLYNAYLYIIYLLNIICFYHLYNFAATEEEPHQTGLINKIIFAK
jgi:hypothetical protein